MLAIELTFPAGRYHATPWAAHVNEGAVEWPPSPWRLLRALIATRHLKASDEVSPDELESLMELLSGELPSYSLPAGIAGFHSRHYMPLFKDKTTLVFDTYLHLGRNAPVVVAWPGLVADPRLAGVLGLLAERLGYLGRAEAWVDARLCEAPADELNCRPAVAGGLEPAGEVVRLLAPVPPADLSRWREEVLSDRRALALAAARRKAEEDGKPIDKARLTPKKLASLEVGLPRSVTEALSAATDVLRKERWNRPPGSQWVPYLRPRLDEPPPARPARPATRLPTVARFAVSGQVLPRLTVALLEAEKIRAALLSHSDAAPVFSGRHPVSGELLPGHQHTFIVPEANGRRGSITHVTLYARMGFDQPARRALERLRTVWHRSGHDLQLVLLALGHPEDFAGTRAEDGECPLLSMARIWVSRTPFVPTRHLKRGPGGVPRLDTNGIPVGAPEHDLLRLLLEADFPRPERVERVAGTELGGRPTRWLAFHTRRRKGGGRRAGLHGVGFRITFPEPVRGPILLGYGAHFGLGCFVPEVDPRADRGILQARRSNSAPPDWRSGT